MVKMWEQHILSPSLCRKKTAGQLKRPSVRARQRLDALIFTVAKRGPVAGVPALAEAAVAGSIQGLACGERVTGIANVREPAWIHQTGEPCCGDTRKQPLFVIPLMLA